METTNEKKETLTIQGNVGSVSEIKGADKKYVDISIATNKPGETAVFKDARVWEEKAKDFDKIKKGDFVKIEGYEKTLKNTKDEDYTVFNVTALSEHKPTEKLKLNGNLGDNPTFDKVGEKNVATLSIATRNGDLTEWKRVQLWDKNAELAKDLKKGDNITVEGKYGKEYTYTKQDQTKGTAQDFIASSLTKTEKMSIEDLNKTLVANAQKGDWKALSENLNKGADSKLVTPEILKDLSDKQKDAINNTIRSHEDFKEKKNSGLKQ